MDSSKPSTDDSLELPPAVLLMRTRQIVRGLMSYNTASRLSNAFVNHVPKGMQRKIENYADFPISSIIRSSNVLFIRVPKCASVSIAKQIYGRVSHVPHRSALFYLRSDPEFYAKSMSFAVLRDPIERAESAFRWLKSSKFSIMKPNPQTRLSLRAILSYEGFVFDYIYPAFKKGRLTQLDPVLHHQRDYVCNEKGEVIVKRLFRMDNMQELQRFLLDNGVKSPEIFENQSPKTTKITSSSEVNEVLRLVYKDDIALFSSISH